jgi:hypothetical protein
VREKKTEISAMSFIEKSTEEEVDFYPVNSQVEPEEKSKINLLNRFFSIMSGSFQKWQFWSPKSKKSTK